MSSFIFREFILTRIEINRATNGKPAAIEILSQGNNSHSVILNNEYANAKAKAMVWMRISLFKLIFFKVIEMTIEFIQLLKLKLVLDFK